MKTSIKALISGMYGDGKSFFCGTCPKSYFISTEPGGFDTIEFNNTLLKNVVKQEYVIPGQEIPLEKYCKVFESKLNEAYEMYKEGKIETLIIDNLTFLAEYYRMYLWQYEKEVTRSGQFDTMRMYGKLGERLNTLFILKVITFPGNVIMTSHLKKENEEALEKKVTNEEIVPDIAGSFRNKIQGMVSLHLVLNKKLDGKSGYKYLANTNLTRNVRAKNRLNLPDVIENINYGTLFNAIKQAKTNS